MTPAEQREQWRQRKRRHRPRERGGICVIPLKDDPGELGDFLREGNYLPIGSEDDPKTLAIGVRAFLRDMRDNDLIEKMLRSNRACPLCNREY